MNLLTDRKKRRPEGGYLMDDVVIVQYEELKRLCIQKLKANSVSGEDAQIVADVLVHADLRGVSSHGIMRLPHYIKRIKAGSINPRPNIKVTNTGPVTAVLDGDDGLGHIVAFKAMEHANKLANSSGVGFVAVINSSHCGALSYYVQQAAIENNIGLAMTNTDKAVVPFGGAKPFLGTNPIAFSFPTGSGKPVLVDMATSSIAYGKILYAKKTCTPIPPNCIVDKEGRHTTDPDKYGALLPFGGPKGYGLSIVVDIFSGILTGMAFGPHVVPMYDCYTQKRKLGHFLGAINISRFIKLKDFLKNMDRLTQEIHAVPPAEDFKRVMMPGERELEIEAQRREEGIPVLKPYYEYLIT